jgi:hypothetical protein
MLRSFFCDSLDFDRSLCFRLRETANLFSRFADYSEDGRDYPGRIRVFEEIFGNVNIAIPVVISFGKVQGNGLFFSQSLDDSHRGLVIEGFGAGFMECGSSFPLRILMDGMGTRGPRFEGHPILVLEETLSVEILSKQRGVNLTLRSGFTMTLTPLNNGDDRLFTEVKKFM